jgi:hypothetical protein
MSAPAATPSTPPSTTTSAATTTTTTTTTTPSRFADRVVKEVPEPAALPLTHAELFDSKDLPRIDVVQDHFLREGR